MVRGIRDRATQAPGYGSFGNVAFNPSADAKLDFISQVTPVISDGDAAHLYMPADLYYVHWGLAGGATGPSWMSENSGTNHDIAQWDATDGRTYRRIGTAGGAGELGTTSSANFKFIYPTGFAGEATQFAPKNPDVQQVIVGSRLRFPDSQDMVNTDGYGWGCIYLASGTQYAGTFDGFAVTRSGANKWRLYSMDGSTRSSTDSTAADDGNWHDVHVVWTTASLTLYVDNVAVITKATNLPTRPLSPYVKGNGTGTTKRIDIVDWRCYWE